MANNFFENIREWFANRPSTLDYNEFERIESKHNRIRHDVDMEERIEVE
jgi:hypothetical protein